ncbi:MAG: hypothetical protein JW776_16515 [Candidatus Lokiarchaeota archaeon]|nr:hypothetical protein [Candidatus Lokiarchaeota archaeon]
MADLSGLVSDIHKKTPSKIGVICVNCILHHSPLENLIRFLKKYSIYLPESTLNVRSELVYYIYYHFFTEYQNDQIIRQMYSDPVEYIGDVIAKDELFKIGLQKHDFIAKHELIDVFADYCADMGIITFEMDPKDEINSMMDLFLTKRVPLLKTETVFVRTGHELENGGYSEELIKNIQEASKKAIWTVFVTSSYGAYVVGLDRLIKDMERLNIWLYVVDPLHKNVYGITKGKKNQIDENLKNQLEQSLPSQPIRAPSQLGKISKYDFSERDSYNPNKFTTFSILKSDIYGMYYEKTEPNHKFRDIFRSLLIIDPVSGLNIFSMKSQTQKIDDVILSGFLSALDSLALEIGTKQEGAKEKEINYQGFIVQIISGDLLNIALFLTKPADQILKERMNRFIHQFEYVYRDSITKYKESGNVAVFPESRIKKLAMDILSI